MRRPFTACAGIVVGLTALHLALNGYSFGGVTDRLPGTSPSSDHANVLPWVHWYRDPTAYPRDFQIQMGAGYQTLLWPAVAALPRAIPLEWVFFVGHVLTLAATYALLVRLAAALGADRTTAWLAALTFTAARVSPAGEPTFDAAFYTRSVGLPLGVAAVLLILRRRPLGAFGCLSAALAVHAATAFHAAAIVVPLWLFTPAVSRRARAAWLAGFAAVAWLLAHLVAPGAAESWRRASPDWLDLQRITNGAHLFMGFWSEDVWRGFVVLLLPLADAAVDPGARPAARRLARATLLAAAGLMLLGWLAADVLPSKLLLRLLPLRGLKFIMVIAIAFVPSWVRRTAARSAALPTRSRILCQAGAMAALAGWAGRLDALAALGFLAVSVAHPTRCGRWLRCATAAAMAGWFAACDLRGHAWTSRSVGLSLAALGIAAGCAALFHAPASSRRGPIRIGLILALAAACLVPLQRDGVWVYAATDYPWRDRQSPWIDVQRWFAAHAPRDALVMVPPWLEGFRTYGRRSLFVDWKSGTVSLFHESFGFEWRDRIGRLIPRTLSGNLYENLAMNYDALTPAAIAAIVRDFGVTHVVLKRSAPPPPYRLVYENAAFGVWQTQ